MNTMNPSSPERVFYTSREFSEMLRMKSTSLFRYADADPEFPQPFNRQKGAKALWRVRDVQQYIHNQSMYPNPWDKYEE